MELGLSLGDGSRQFNIRISSEKSSSSNSSSSSDKIIHKVLLRNNSTDDDDDDDHGRDFNTTVDGDDSTDDDHRRVASSDPPVQLDLLPLAPVPRHNSSTTSSHLGLPWSSIKTNFETGLMGGFVRGFDVNRAPSIAEDHEINNNNNNNGNVVSSPNSTLSSFHQMEFSMGCRENGTTSNKRDFEDALGGSGNEIDAERACSRASDDEDNPLNRKKLRLSKEQSAFLEESFKEHSTLNPKQKLALAKQLNLSPRQVEVWFQNRRARTKLKQTEVDCEYLKRCCETLTEENRRLQKELQELRTLKTSNPYYMQLPATTLTMCPSCERVATTSTAPAGDKAAGSVAAPATKASAFSIAKPMFYPLTTSQPQQQTS
ncbi:hypothetical protein Syun_017354 [Stephania yunnanensis]|uniref:Homeobox domain-containing protein n=1 Tax=Stephania yunnanensis TaxID=152371 RepID=A0AAP0P2A9_9MAGN